MLKKIILSVLMASAVLSGTAFAASSTPAVPTPQALKNGSSGGSAGGSGSLTTVSAVCQNVVQGFLNGKLSYTSQTDANNFVSSCQPYISSGTLSVVSAKDLYAVSLVPSTK